MAYKYYNFRTIDAGQGRRIELRTQDTNYGFRHIAEFYDGTMIGYAKACYYNRTWESYDYQSVIHDVIDNAGVEDPEALKKVIDTQELKRINDDFGVLGAIMNISNVLSEDPAEQSDFKLRMLRARFGNAVNIPEDWDRLSTEEQNSRLDKISAMFMGASNE